MFTADELLTHRAWLLTRLRRWVRQDAEDLTQDTLLRAWQARARFQAGHLRPWLFTIARRLAVNHVTRRQPSKRLPARKAVYQRPDEGLIRQETVHRVRCAVESLLDRQRRAIVLFCFDGQGCDEIGVQLGLSNQAVKSLLSRSRASLRRRLAALA